MKVKLKAIHKAYTEAEQAQFGQKDKIHTESFAGFQDEDGNVVKLMLSLDELKPIKIGVVYDFDIKFEPSANLVLPKAAVEADSKPLC